MAEKPSPEHSKLDYEQRTEQLEQAWSEMMTDRLANPKNQDDALAELQQAKAESFEAYRDHLTGLLNRRAFEAVLNQMAEQSARETHSEKREKNLGDIGITALVVLDLKGFREINNVFGYERGDEVLTDVARAFESELRPGDVVARIGGDEVALLLDNTANLDEVSTALDRVKRQLPRNPVTGKTIEVNPDKLVIELLSRTDPAEVIQEALDRALREMHTS